MGIQTSLDAVAEASTIVDGMRLADDLAFEAGRDPGVRTLRVLSRAMQGTDQLVVIAAIHALAEINDGEAARLLVQLLDDDRAFVREHAAWAVGSGMPRPEAIGRLLALVVAGRLHRDAGAAHARAVVGGRAGAPRRRRGGRAARGDAARRRAAVSSRRSGSCGPRSRPLRSFGSSVDHGEAEVVRVAATAALGQRAGAPDVGAHARVADGRGRADRRCRTAGAARPRAAAMPVEAGRTARPHGGAAVPARRHRPRPELGRSRRQRRHRDASRPPRRRPGRRSTPAPSRA